VGLIGVVLGFILNVFKDWFNLHLNRTERAKYLAIRVTVVLEKFAHDCLEVARDDGHIVEPDEHGCLQFSTSYVMISYGSLDVDWKSLPLDLMYEILNLPSQVAAAIDKINIVAEYGSGPPNYEEEIEERRLQYVRLGLQADDLSTRLLKKYKLPKKSRDTVDDLNEVKVIIEKIRKERESHESKQIR
jgi:hypothetical protein